MEVKSLNDIFRSTGFRQKDIPSDHKNGINFRAGNKNLILGAVISKKFILELAAWVKNQENTDYAAFLLTNWAKANISDNGGVILIPAEKSAPRAA